jgi:hypothetical protein
MAEFEKSGVDRYRLGLAVIWSFDHLAGMWKQYDINAVLLSLRRNPDL